MTIEDLYEWAKRHGVADYDLIIDGVDTEPSVCIDIDSESKKITLK